MFKKLLQAAAVVFLLTSFAVAVLSIETLGPRTNEYYNKAHTAFLLIYFFGIGDLFMNFLKKFQNLSKLRVLIFIDINHRLI